MAYNDDSIELFQQQNAIEEANDAFSKSKKSTDLYPLPNVLNVSTGSQSSLRRGAGRAAFSPVKREARQAQQEQMATEEAARQEAEGDPTPLTVQRMDNPTR